MDVKNLVGLDFETYGAVDLRTHGLKRYISDSTFRPLIARLVTYDRNLGLFDHQAYDFTTDMQQLTELLRFQLHDMYICAHNAGFEEAVLDWLGITVPPERFIDSAVIARAAGGGSHLEAAAPQLLNWSKLPDGHRLIKLFSVPSKAQVESGNLEFDPDVIKQNPGDWKLFGEYCEVDAKLSLKFAVDFLIKTSTLKPFEDEWTNNVITMRMNTLGWHVDVPMVEEMQRRYIRNMDEALENFRRKCNAPDLNLNSLKQMKEWCAERGIKATSFDENHVISLLNAIEKKLRVSSLPTDKFNAYDEVSQLLRTKQILGGSSLKKLQVILDTVGDDGRLRDQYLHIGAGQTYRTTGRSVQMQNLKRITTPGDMDDLLEDTYVEWDNTKLAENLRQVFTATDPQGQLIVGDFASVESRKLAWLAGQTDKVEAFRKGVPMYEQQAALIYGVPLEQVTKAQRQTGKVGELSCGYQASGPAVQSFASKMGVSLTEGEASKLVSDWRAANPKIMLFWDTLHEMLLSIMEGEQTVSTPVGHRASLTFSRVIPPVSLLRQHRGVISLKMQMTFKDGTHWCSRLFHGLHMHGRDIRYYKPSDRKSGDLWRNTYTDPKTGLPKPHTLYGGKLTGILTQSSCRELFFRSLRSTQQWVDGRPNVDIVGQFHDEIVLDWSPSASGIPFDDAISMLQASMETSALHNFPLKAEIKSDYRYTK